MASSRSTATTSSTVARHPHNRRSSSSANIHGQAKTHHPSLGFTVASEAGPSGSSTTSAPANKRRQSSELGEDGHHAHGTGKIGPKRKSKVGISGMGHHHHHAVHGMTRKNNASSTGLVGRKDLKRSHASLANLASEIAAAYEADPAAQGMERSSSRGGADIKQKGRANKQTQLAREEEDGEGWVSANSSTAVTPEAGTSPMSPESYKPLEIGKKARRNKKPPIPELTFEKQEVRVSNFDEPQPIEGGTPTQSSGFALGGLSRASAQQKSQSNLSRLGEAAHQSPFAHDGGDVTPSAEEGEDSGPPTPRLPVDEAAAAKKEGHAPTEDQLKEIAKSLSPSLQQQSQQQEPTSSDKKPKEDASDLPIAPPLVNVKPRLANLRKTSSSTIRSLTSMTGPRPPLSAGMRKSTAPLEPTLDTKTQCFGEILEETLSPVMVGGQSFGSRNNVPFPADQSGPIKPKRDRTISGNSAKSNAGTLTAQEAEDLARRLRSVSGTDLQNMDAGSARAALRRSASSSYGFSLSGNGPASPRTDSGGAFGTLKRASGYFGSIGRLTGLTGLTSTSSGNLSNSPPSPVVGQNVSAAQANLMNNASSSPNLSRSGASQRRAKQVSITAPTPTLQQQQQQYRSPPLISKFIEPNAGSTMSFANGSEQASQKSRGTVSRARQKMLTQRDAPFPLSGAEQPYTPGRSSDDDPSSSASQLNLRGAHTQSGASTPLEPGVREWLQALAKEMQRIDTEHTSNSRWRDELNASVARVLMKLEKQDQEREREKAEALTAGGSSSAKT